MPKYMLDTDIVIYTIKNRPEKIKKMFLAHHEQTCISTVTLMELVYGAEKSADPRRNLGYIEGFIARLEVVSYDGNAARHSGEIRAELSKSGRLIGPYDLMIAGHARSLGCILVTNNTKEFTRVDGLRLDNWSENQD